MTHTVTVVKGSYRGQTIENTVFEVVKPLNTAGASGPFITVDGTGHAGLPAKAIRVKVDSPEMIVDGAAVTKKKRTDQEIMDEMRQRFSVLDKMTYASLEGTVRGLIVTGPPGIGKSFGVEGILDEALCLQKLQENNGSTQNYKLGVEKGAASAIGVFQMLYEYSKKGSVLVLDDSDTILYDETSLNLLKAALDSGKRRRLTWRSESKALKDSGTPSEFEFKGSVIFITNLNFEKSRGKIAAHLEALMSRCHYLDMGIDGMREKFLRCKQIVADGMLKSYNFTPEEEQDILDFIYDNKDRLRELSLRMVTKIADLKKMDRNEWRVLASSTCLRNA